MLLFTERKALEVMFSNLEEDKRQIKKQAREDISSIETRQMNILDRLQRLDNMEREAVDTEGLLHEFSHITRELGALIPQVAASEVIERAAEKIVADPIKRDQIITEPKTDILQDKIKEAARLQLVNSKPVPAPSVESKRTKAQTMSNKQGAEWLEIVLREAGKPLRANNIAKLLKSAKGKEYANIHGAILRWIEESGGKIIKKGSTYLLASEEPENYGEQKTGNE